MKRVFVIFRINIMSSTLIAALLFTARGGLVAQNVIGGLVGSPSAILDLQSTSKGLLIPRLTTAERDAIQNPVEGLLIYNTTRGCLEMNIGGESSPDWACLAGASGRISGLSCGAATQSGLLVEGAAADAVVSLSYSGGNRGLYGGQTIQSAGVTGLTATLLPGTFAEGSGVLSFAVTGVPAGIGEADFTLDIGGQRCNLRVAVSPSAGTITALNCSGVTASKALIPFVALSDVSVSIPYTGGNGGMINAQSVASTGVTGLTATLSDSPLQIGSGTLTYTLSGTPSGSGAARFDLNVADQTCTLQLGVNCGFTSIYGDFIVYKCHNLGADTTANPFTPSWRLNGNYYQWGRNPSCFGRDGTDAANPCTSPVYGAAAPWGNTSSNDNAGAISGWSSTNASNTAWNGFNKGAEDPCPSGFRVPDRTNLELLYNGVTRSAQGSWTAGSTNFSSGMLFANTLFMPAAGSRNSSGALTNRDAFGQYWSSSVVTGTDATYLFFSASTVATSSLSKITGLPVRCMAQ